MHLKCFDLQNKAIVNWMRIFDLNVIFNLFDIIMKC